MSFLGNQIISYKMKMIKKHKNPHTFQEEINKFSTKLYKQDKISINKIKSQDHSVQKDKLRKISVSSLLRIKV